MPAPHAATRSDPSDSTRRQFLLGGAAVGVGAVSAAGISFALTRNGSSTAAAPLHGGETVPFYGTHQAGVDTDAQAHATLLGLDLRDGVGRDDLRRMMVVLSDDAARLTQGFPALADSEPELAVAPARLTVTFGFGPEFVNRAEAARPKWLRPLPTFSIDQLEPEYSSGDLLIQVASDDPVTVTHASRVLLKGARSFASLRWMQTGFRRAHGTVKPETTMRNLFGQVDGTTNPTPGTEDFDQVVWCTEGWMEGGTSLAMRRIRMNLDDWDRLGRHGRDQATGRFQSNGAPLTSSPDEESAEFDEPDFDARTELGLTVIPASSHVARARSDNPKERILRRSYNYEELLSGRSTPDSGLIFLSYQADTDAQFVPIQRRLDELDLLNEWTTPVGSSVFAIPPGCEERSFIGDTILT